VVKPLEGFERKNAQIAGMKGWTQHERERLSEITWDKDNQQKMNWV
jgi:hypothetical protein